MIEHSKFARFRMRRAELLIVNKPGKCRHSVPFAVQPETKVESRKKWKSRRRTRYRCQSM
jgi:hypothetical protein